ncbi:MAG: serine/threonine protein kinase [Bdellovibrionota bacterium]
MLAKNEGSMELAFEGGLAQIFKKSAGDTFRAEKILLPQYQGLVEFENLQRREFEILSRLNHPKILKCFELNLESPKPGVFTHVLELEWIEGLSVRDLIFQARSWNLEDRKSLAFNFLRQSLEIFSYLESQHLIHSDLSPENFILNREGKLVLIDFASAFFENDPPSKNSAQLTGKKSYRAPELREDERPTFAAETYSLGRIFEEILGPKSLQDSQIKNLAHQLVFDRQAVQINQIPEATTDFFQKILWKDLSSKSLKQVTSKLQSAGSWKWSYSFLPMIWLSLSSPIEIRAVSVNSMPPTTLCIEALSVCHQDTPIKNINLALGEWSAEFFSIGDPDQKWSRILSVKRDKPLKFFEDFRNTVSLKE